MKSAYIFAIAVMSLSSCNGDSQCELRLERLQKMRDNNWFVIDPADLNGSEYLQLDEQAQQHYVDGIIDGMRLAPLLGAYDQTYPESKLRTLLYCVTRWDNKLKTVVDDYFLAHPEKLKDSSHGLIYIALAEACNDMLESCQDTTCQGLSRM